MCIKALDNDLPCAQSTLNKIDCRFHSCCCWTCSNQISPLTDENIVALHVSNRDSLADPEKEDIVSVSETHPPQEQAPLVGDLLKLRGTCLGSQPVMAGPSSCLPFRARWLLLWRTAILKFPTTPGLSWFSCRDATTLCPPFHEWGDHTGSCTIHSLSGENELGFTGMSPVEDMVAVLSFSSTPWQGKTTNPSSSRLNELILKWTCTAFQALFEKGSAELICPKAIPDKVAPCVLL